MAASDAAFSRSFNRAENTRKVDKASAKAEERQGVVDERSETLFNRSTTLFEQQQKFLKDDRALQQFGRDANRAVSMFRASGGQVFQPMLDTYKSLPDGGQFHEFRRNDDGSFDFEVEWQGQRFKKQGATFDDIGNMMMSIANPAKYLEDSGAAAAAAAKFTQDKELARIKALKGQKAELKVFNGQITLDDYNDTREKFKDEFLSFLEKDPTMLDIPDPGAEEGTRQMTFEEYQAGKFGALGIDVTGSQFGDDGKVGQTPPINLLTATFPEMVQFGIDEQNLSPIEAVGFAADDLIAKKQFDELQTLLDNGAFTDLGSGGIFDDSGKIERKVKAALAAESGDTGENIEVATDEVNADSQTKAAKKEPVLDPIAQFAENNKAPTFADLKRDVGSLLSFISKKNAELRTQQGRKKAIATWKAIATTKPRRGSDAFKILAAAQTPKGREEAAKLYSEIRSLLPPELTASLDATFLKDQSETRLANDQAPDAQRSGSSAIPAPSAP